MPSLYSTEELKRLKLDHDYSLEALNDELARLPNIARQFTEGAITVQELQMRLSEVQYMAIQAGYREHLLMEIEARRREETR